MGDDGAATTGTTTQTDTGWGDRGPGGPMGVPPGGGPGGSLDQGGATGTAPDFDGDGQPDTDTDADSGSTTQQS